MTNEFTVYTRRIAYELRKRGFEVMRTDVNPSHPEFDCWVFEKTPALIGAFESLARERNI